ncbi:DUF5067 domain-containing protein [Bifidobacterium sp. ESL0763]|uniref:DUF5067 domain-containing protein n=1 Tax=Bifidobacterium sp. ESL0763 TaxID=2983227 RepID=UPI0023F71003|nr:DUF5067 domain-containing protein [Bifidobacterium sp. ESL0763]MDF7663194.1 DUF5067 domain-containing protein [Bifidobacterium sp. ESL0763]
MQYDNDQSEGGNTESLPNAQQSEQGLPQAPAAQWASSDQPSVGQLSAVDQSSAGLPLVASQPKTGQLQADSWSKLGIASLLLGVLTIVLFKVPGIGVGCGIAAIAAGVVAIRKIRASLGMPVAGLVTGIIGLILAVIMVVTPTDMRAAMVEKMKNPAHAGTSQFDSETFQRTKGKVLKNGGSFSGGEVKIVSARKGPADNDGNPSVIVTYRYTNTDKESRCFMEGVWARVFQDGVELDRAKIAHDTSGYDDSSEYRAVQRGHGVDVSIAYQLHDKSSPVDVELSSNVNFDDQTTIKGTLQLS